MTCISLKPFVPSGADYALAQRFFSELGFGLNWEAPGVCELQCGSAVFLLQDYANAEMQQNFMLKVEVEDLDAFHRQLLDCDLATRYPGVRFSAPEDRPWGSRELHLIDPAGVCWHFA